MEYDKLYNELVPASGEAENLFGEAVRAVGRLGYEYLNNGNCNAREETEIEGDWVECSCCGGSGVCEDEDGEEYDCPECGGDGAAIDKYVYTSRDDVETRLPELEKELAKNLWRDTRNFFIHKVKII